MICFFLKKEDLTIQKANYVYGVMGTLIEHKKKSREGLDNKYKSYLEAILGNIERKEEN